MKQYSGLNKIIYAVLFNLTSSGQFARCARAVFFYQVGGGARAISFLLKPREARVPPDGGTGTEPVRRLVEWGGGGTSPLPRESGRTQAPSKGRGRRPPRRSARGVPSPRRPHTGDAAHAPTGNAHAMFPRGGGAEQPPEVFPVSAQLPHEPPPSGGECPRLPNPRRR